MAQLSAHAPRTPVLNETSSFVGATEKHTGTLVKWKIILVTIMKLLRSHTRDTAEVSDRKWPSLQLYMCNCPPSLVEAYLHFPSSSNSLVNGHFVKRFHNSALNEFENGYNVLSFSKRRVSSYLTLTVISLLMFFFKSIKQF